ncbi:MAG: hypothetical protein KGL39_47340 [Patescibacteria group bacterium]|nr:hypothetical protein [Patescibacteria group bacterium]
MSVDYQWVQRLPEFAESVRSGKVALCAACQHYRSAPDISALGKCRKSGEETWAFVPFDCKDFSALSAADSKERWLAEAIGGEETAAMLADLPDREERGEFLRNLVAAKGCADRVVGRGDKQRTISECVRLLYGCESARSIVGQRRERISTAGGVS